MAGIIISSHSETPTSITLQTSKGTPIKNEQYRLILEQEIRQEEDFGKQFGGRFQGEASKIYNCHGLTFATKRTGIFEDEMIAKILSDEYVEIKDQKSVEVGDAVIWHNQTAGAIHSAIVVSVENIGGLTSVKVLSKTRSYKEIVHLVQNSPYPGDRRFYRISHGKATIIK